MNKVPEEAAIIIAQIIIERTLSFLTGTSSC